MAAVAAAPAAVHAAVVVGVIDLSGYLQDQIKVNAEELAKSFFLYILHTMKTGSKFFALCLVVGVVCMQTSFKVYSFII